MIARPRQLLHRILDHPGLVDGVQGLAPRALGRLIRHVGLEDASEIISLATTEQLAAVFDDDLWRAERPGADESFDGARFALWLEVMVEAGAELAARHLTELDEDLVALALHTQVMVIDMDQLAVEMADREDMETAILEKALESCPHEELGSYRVIARRHDGWDAILSALLALDVEHHDFLDRLLGRLAHASRDSIDESGLYELLTAEQTLEADAAGEREDRRARDGYVAPSAAASFLALARGTGEAAEDPITRAYFRELQPRAARPAPTGAPDLVEVLRGAGVLEGPLLGTGDAGAGASESTFRDALAALGGRDPDRHERQLSELNYLANVLMAGCGLDGRRFRPFEAAAAVVATCNLGLELQLTSAGPVEPVDLVERAGAVALFRAGWRVLHDQVALPARHARERARDLDADAAAALAGLSGDCPCLTASLAGARPRVFIATEAHLRAAQELLARLTSGAIP
ncbi:MAG TPA: DUF6178 family protein [Kofleriaceae bacterium]|nr:DUF6178 family protein [Kofleriaceae bacterium]